MFDKCPEKVKKCQQPKEYSNFEKEFLLDIEATIAAIEDVCPVAKMKSLKSCLVFTTHNMSHINYGNINSFKENNRSIFICFCCQVDNNVFISWKIRFSKLSFSFISTLISL